MQTANTPVKTSDWRRVGHWVAHMTAMIPQTAAAKIEISRLMVLCGPTGLMSISNGATPRRSTTAATMKRVKRSRLRAPRYAESQSK
ncbi:hypothetical protein MARA_14940 [Mycolicibacterium arabiense]|uniref:Uncharacterized protein n=1 Tax=Mycolicibacterium arabiense TaxID=1286181 RepID=A0A7I7RVG6_9MYCO|nr:hypothetical protein MARA_14940 [Mycolicibacterium arabiense]